MGKVIVLGSINIDTVIRTPRFPALGETLRTRSVKTMPGGKGANQAVAATAAGAETVLLSAVGSDAPGEFYRAHLQASHVRTDYVRTVPGATGSATIIVDDAGDNVILFDPGANETIGEAEIACLRSIAEPGDVLSVMLEVPDATAEQGLRAASDLGITSIFNPSPWSPRAQELADLADIVIVNQQESMQLHRVDDRVCITFGAHGALWQGIHVKAERIEAADTTGAGDTFAGTLAAHTVRGADPEAALQAAVEAATIACTQHGAQEWRAR